MIQVQIWRRDRDSNPGWAKAHNGFRNRRLRPLSHLSASVKIWGVIWLWVPKSQTAKSKIECRGSGEAAHGLAVWLPRRKYAQPRAVHSGRERISALCGGYSLRPGRKCARPRAVQSGRERISALCGGYSLRPECAARGRTHEEAIFWGRGWFLAGGCLYPIECTMGVNWRDWGRRENR